MFKQAWPLFALPFLLLLTRFFIFGEFSSYVLGGGVGDAGIYYSISKSFNWEMVKSFETEWLHPHGKVLAWSDNFLFPASLASALSKITEFPLAYNIVLLAALILNGIFFYLLAFELSKNREKAFLTALLFQSLHFLLAHSGRPQLYFIFYIPLFILLFLKSFKSGGILFPLLTGAALTLSFYSSIYIFLFIILIGAVLFLTFIKAFLNKERIVTAMLMALPLIFILPSLPHYLAVKESFGSRGLHEAFYFGGTALNLIAPSSLSLAGSLLGARHGESGIGLPLALTLFIIVSLFRRSGFRIFFILFGLLLFLSIPAVRIEVVSFTGRKELYFIISFLLWGTLFAGIRSAFIYFREEKDLFYSAVIILLFLSFVLSFGPLGRGDGELPATSPYTLFYHLFPGFDGIRAPVRLLLITEICVLLLLLKSSLLCSKSGWGAVVISVVEVMAVAYPKTYNSTPPEVLRDITGRKSVLFLPLTPELSKDQIGGGKYAELNTAYMEWSTAISNPVINGYSGVVSKLMRELPFQLNKDKCRSIHSISDLGFVVTKENLTEKCLTKLKEGKDGYILYSVNEDRDADNTFLFHPQSSQVEILFNRPETSTCTFYLARRNGEFKEITAASSGNKAVISLPLSETLISPFRLKIKCTEGLRITQITSRQF